MPLQTQVELRKVEQTERILDTARTALLGYAAANGYLPCPADESSVGQEAPGTNHETGHCPTYFGFLPAAALGMDVREARGYGVDAWGSAANRIRYAVAPYSVGAVANAMTRTNGMRTAGVARLSDPSLSLFHVCDSGSGNSRRFDLRQGRHARVFDSGGHLVLRRECCNGRGEPARGAEPEREWRQRRPAFRQPSAFRLHPAPSSMIT